jgi:hypothetical protein
MRLRRLLLVAGLPWLVHDVLAESAVAAVADMVGLARAGQLVWQARSHVAMGGDRGGWAAQAWRGHLVALVSARISFADPCDGNGLRTMVNADDSEPDRCTRSPAAEMTDSDAILAAMTPVCGLGWRSGRA